MLSFLSKTIKIVGVFIGTCLCLLLLLIFPFLYDSLYNEFRLIIFEIQTKEYTHPVNSKLVQKFSMIGNFAPASNQCGFIIAEVRTTTLTTDATRSFYIPILTDISYADGPPYHEVNLYLMSNEKDIENLRWQYSEVYERIRDTETNTNDYLLLTSKTGYPPNFDLRCH